MLTPEERVQSDAQPKGGLVLYHAPRSPFCLKVRLSLALLGLTDKVEHVALDPWTDIDLRSLNPLSQVPTLVSHTGEALFGSAVIARYLNDLASAELFPDPPWLWGALRREAAADGMVQATVRRFVERLDEPSERALGVIRRQEAAIAAVLDDAERELNGAGDVLDIGHVSLAAAITYLDRRSPELEWGAGRPILSMWYDQFLKLPCATVLVSAHQA